MLYPRPSFATTLLAPAQPTEQAKNPAAIPAPLGRGGAPLSIADRIHRPDGRIGS